MQNSQLIYRVLDSCLRHFWLLLLCTLLVTGGGVAAVIQQANNYSATALTRIAGNDLASALGQPGDDKFWITPAQRHVNHLNDLLSDDVRGGFMGRALKRARLAKPMNPDPEARDPRYGLFRKTLAVYTGSDQTFAIGVEWEHPEDAERIVKGLQEEYFETVGDSQQSKTQAISQFLEREIRSYARRMQEAEQALTDYKQSHSGDLPEAQDADIKQLASLRSSLDDLRIRAKDGELKRAALQQRIAQIEPTITQKTMVNDDPVAKQLKELEVKRELLLVDYKPQSPVVQEVDAQITALQRYQERLASAPQPDSVVSRTLQENPEYQHLNKLLTDANIERNTHAAQMALLVRQIGTYEERIRRMPAAQRELADKTRDYSILKEQYEKLLQRREQAKLTANIDRVTVRSSLSRIGGVQADRTLSKKKMAVLLGGGFVAGLVLGFVMVVLREWADGSFRYEEDVERSLGVPVLAILPDTREMRALPAPRSPSRDPVLPSPPTPGTSGAG